MITVLLIAIGLSMDAFSLSLVYGTLNLNKKIIILQSLIVGLYHFFMPIMGNYIGYRIFKIISINPNVLVFGVLTIIGIQMIIDLFKKEETKKIDIIEMIFFGFAVSMDSFSIGLGLSIIYENIIISITTFMMVSFIFTYLGLTIGKKANKILGNISTIIGGVILIIIGLFYIV